MTFPLLSPGGLRRMQMESSSGGMNETTGGCLDFVQQKNIKEGSKYFVDACTQCLCVTNGGPTMCHQISCSEPVDCPPNRLHKLATQCCQVCEDGPLTVDPSHGPHVGVSMQLGSLTVTFVLILILVLFVMHRARKKRFFMALTRLPMMRRNSSGNGGCSSDEITVDQQITTELPLRSVVIGGEVVINPDPPPPYSLPVDNPIVAQRVIGEPPPPYAATVTTANLIQQQPRPTDSGPNATDFTDSDSSSSSGMDDDYFTPSMSESETEVVECDCPNCCLSNAQRAVENRPAAVSNCHVEPTHSFGIVSTQLRYNGESTSMPVTEILPSLCPDCHHRVNQQLSNDSTSRLNECRNKQLRLAECHRLAKSPQGKRLHRAVRRKVKKVPRTNPRPTRSSTVPITPVSSTQSDMVVSCNSDGL